MNIKSAKIAVFGLFSALLLLGFGFGAGASETATAAPRVQIAQERYVFDPVVEGTEVSHAFPIRNVGDAPLVINKVRTG